MKEKYDSKHSPEKSGMHKMPDGKMMSDEMMKLKKKMMNAR